MKIGDTKAIFYAKMDTIKDRNGKALREAEEIKKRWQENTEELHTKRSCLLFNCSVVSDCDPMDCSLPCPSLSPRVCSNSCPLGWWCLPTILSSRFVKKVLMTQLTMVWSLTLSQTSWSYEAKWALRSITMNKASGSDGIPAELFQILKDDAVKVLHSICQQI